MLAPAETGRSSAPAVPVDSGLLHCPSDSKQADADAGTGDVGLADRRVVHHAFLRQTEVGPFNWTPRRQIPRSSSWLVCLMPSTRYAVDARSRQHLLQDTGQQIKWPETKVPQRKFRGSACQVRRTFTMQHPRSPCGSIWPDKSFAKRRILPVAGGGM